MSPTTTIEPTYPGAVDAPTPTSGPRDFSSPSLAALTRIELRKASNTRSGKWVLGLMFAAQLIVVIAVAIFAGEDADKTFASALQGALAAPGLLLGIVGILLVTSEWSQRTAMATFTLVPNRMRVIVAKVAAMLSLTVVSMIWGLVVAALTAAIVGAPDTWDLSVLEIAQGLLYVALGALSGVGLGLLIGSPAPAIVASFAISAVFGILAGLISALEDVVKWLDPAQAFAPLAGFDVSSLEWGRIGTAALLWIVLTIVLGTRRVLRSEIK